VGLLAVELSDAAAADPVFGHMPRSFPTLQWHSDTFDLPEGSTLLAGSPAYPRQAFVYKRAYGLQFHLEVSPELAAVWGSVPAYAASLERMLGEGSLPGFLAEVEANADVTLPLPGGCSRAGSSGWSVCPRRHLGRTLRVRKPRRRVGREHQALV
jgi:hypothetical protein